MNGGEKRGRTEERRVMEAEKQAEIPVRALYPLNSGVN